MRTWDENRLAINQLWPNCQWTDEERRLWHDDLSGLDQGTLYDAMRNVKRNRDTMFPHLKWILDEYRELDRAKRNATRKPRQSEPKLNLRIDETESSKLADDFVALIEVSSPADFASIEEKLLDKSPKMTASAAVRVLQFARRRLLGETSSMCEVTPSGETKALTIGGIK